MPASVKPLSSDFLASIPGTPGIYLMKGLHEEVLYVGKARDLKKRLSSYARKSNMLPPKTVVMLTKVVVIDTILTRTEKEALILEAQMIKKHRPRYNVILRDDKSYPFIKVTVKEEWPRVSMTRRRLNDAARYFGPYSSPSAMWGTLRYLAQIFPLRLCKGGKLQKRQRPCLNYQMGRCLAPCAGIADHEKYMDRVRNVLLVLEGKSRELVKGLMEKMHDAAARLDFEEAAFCRDRIKALESTLEKQVVVASHSRDSDVFGLVRKDAAVVISLLLIRSGMVSGQQSFFLAGPAGTDNEIIGEAIIGYYSEYLQPPREIVTSILPDEADLLTDWLADQKKGPVELMVPKRGERLELIHMAIDNGAKLFQEKEKKHKSWQALAGLMKKYLRLDRRPEQIECLDISNIGGRQAVGSLVSFQAGEANKPGYRHYRITSGDTPDDYGMMREVLWRRLTKGQEAGDLPDLLILDGGKGQLNVAIAVKKDLNLTAVPELIAIAKEKQDEGEKLFRPGRLNPILLPRHSPVLLYLMRIRDESHRFGITFHRRLRSKETLKSALDRIPGVGAVRRQALLKQLGSVKKIESASLEELASVAGIGRDLAAKIWRHLHPS